MGKLGFVDSGSGQVLEHTSGLEKVPGNRLLLSSTLDAAPLPRCTPEQRDLHVNDARIAPRGSETLSRRGNSTRIRSLVVYRRSSGRSTRYASFPVPRATRFPVHHEQHRERTVSGSRSEVTRGALRSAGDWLSPGRRDADATFASSTPPPPPSSSSNRDPLGRDRPSSPVAPLVCGCKPSRAYTCPSCVSVRGRAPGTSRRRLLTEPTPFQPLRYSIFLAESDRGGSGIISMPRGRGWNASFGTGRMGQGWILKMWVVSFGGVLF